MKKFQIAGLAALSILGSMTAAQAQATTEPVGYVTETLTPGTFNVVGITLHEAPTVSGTFETVSTTSLTDNDIDFSTALVSNTAYILEITSGTANGEIQYITSTDISTNTITTADDLQALGLSVNDTYSIRKAATLASIFGADNSAGLLGNSSSSTADQVWVAGESGFVKYFYNVNPFNPAASSWKEVDTGNIVDATSIPIYYTESIYVVTASSGANREIVITGSVKSTATTYILEQGYNYIGTSFPAGTTLSSSDLESQITGSSSATLADVISVPDGSGNFARYFYNINPFNPSANGWKNADTAADVDATTITLPSAILIQRKGTETNVTIEPTY